MTIIDREISRIFVSYKSVLKEFNEHFNKEYLNRFSNPLPPPSPQCISRIKKGFIWISLFHNKLTSVSTIFQLFIHSSYENEHPNVHNMQSMVFFYFFFIIKDDLNDRNNCWYPVSSIYCGLNINFQTDKCLCSYQLTRKTLDIFLTFLYLLFFLLH